MQHERCVSSLAGMHELAAEVASTLTGGEALLLYGELGSGKTTFVQGLARALGVAEHVTSPSYTVMTEYPVKGHAAIARLVHIDLYRLAAGAAASDPAVADALELARAPDRVTVIEWADRLGEAVPAMARRLVFQHGRKPDERMVELWSW